MSPNDQVDIILTQPGTVLHHITNLVTCLPLVDEKRLRKIASFLDNWLRQRSTNPSISSSTTSSTAAASAATASSAQGTSVASSLSISIAGVAGTAADTPESPVTATAAATSSSTLPRYDEVAELFLHTLLRSSWNELDVRRRAIAKLQQQQQQQQQQTATASNNDSSSPTSTEPSGSEDPPPHSSEETLVKVKKPKSLSFAPSVTKDSSSNKGKPIAPSTPPPTQPQSLGMNKLLASRRGIAVTGSNLTSTTAPLVQPTAMDVSTPPTTNAPPAAAAAAAPAPATVDDSNDSVTKYFYKQLRLLLGSYRPSIVLMYCVQLGHWDAAAEVYDILQDWPQSLEFRLRSIAQGWAAFGNFVPSAAEEINVALGAAENVLLKIRGRCHPSIPILLVETVRSFYFSSISFMGFFFLLDPEILAPTQALHGQAAQVLFGQPGPSRCPHRCVPRHDAAAEVTSSAFLKVTKQNKKKTLQESESPNDNKK